MEVLFRKFVPDDNTAELSLESRALKKKVGGKTNINLDPIISFNKIKMTMSKSKHKKAPGMDNFEIEIVRELWRKVPVATHGLMNNCLSQRIFPRRRKEANLKDENRDRTLLNSYRPIALLTVIGKLFEKINVNRFQEAYKDAGLKSPDQFGFKKGKGTDDAFLTLRRAIKFYEKIYIIIIFVDIEGALDNLW